MFQSKPMKLPNYYVLIIFFSITTATTKLVPRYAKPGCNEKCGNLTIPYPFGIGPNWCGTVAVSSGGNAVTGCSVIRCEPHERLNRSSCDEMGTNCCQTNVPYYLKNYSMNVTSNQSCVSAFLVADVGTLFPNKSFPGDRPESSSIPTVLNWTLPERYFTKVNCGYNFSTLELKMGLHTSVFTGKCSCPYEFNEGNPYLSGECKVTEECTKCMEMSGFCVYKVSYGGRRTFICDQNVDHHGRSKSRAAFLGILILIKCVCILLIFCWFCF
ncbi:hypothetical protein HanRHA438_Chr15g0716271 [Helianthus annuus]|nr:hypothetical protein HanRHA438_Chr15g0716271 [Helianthus annuus]